MALLLAGACAQGSAPGPLLDASMDHATSDGNVTVSTDAHAADALVCADGGTRCGAACVDTATSAANCGACGRTCAATELCAAGACVSAVCSGAEVRCGGVCVDTSRDAANCGACGHACAGAMVCRAGACATACAAPQVSCATAGTGSGTACTDTSTDVANCGACGHVCATGMRCAAGACGCATGESLCAGACTATSTDVANCGTCGHACAATQTCASGVCNCPAGRTDCTGTCVNTMTDVAHCGTCANACTAPSTCNAGACNSLCGTGTTSCGGTCVSVAVDPHNCGACGTVCGAGTTCATGACRPVNDARASATVLTLATTEVTVHGTTVGATHDGATPCGCTSGGDVWYRFHIATAGVVYFDTAGSNFDTSLYFTDSAGTSIVADAPSGYGNAGHCNDDAYCTTGGFVNRFESQTAAYFAGAGDYALVVGGCATGAFTLHAQYVPSNVGATFVAARISGTGSATGTLVSADTTAGTCGGVTTAPPAGEDVRWFTTCGGAAGALFSLCTSDGGTFQRRVNATYFDPAMYVRSAMTGTEVTCNDDGGSMGGTACAGTVAGTGGSSTLDGLAYASRIDNVVIPRGLAVEFVDSRSGATSDRMGYTLVWNVH